MAHSGRMLRQWLVPLVGLLWLLACRAPQAEPPSALTVSAASDLVLAFDEIGNAFTDQTGVPVVFNFGSTGLLAQQIEEGAPVDVFAAANIAYVEDLAQKGIIDPDSITLYARGRLVLWTLPEHGLTIERLEDLTDPRIRRIAIANPDHAPYGMAAREALQRAGVWETVQPKLVLGENVRQAFQYAATGNVDVAIIALSLAIPSDGEWVLVPETYHAPIDQAMGIVRTSRMPREAADFVAFVNSEEGRAIMKRYGFLLPNETLP
ncbi:molybdate ABC transporter substrate-binding protein [Ardenticatena maritima]|nr:molybdate ABC transporter substrate-binding protein [Ardenticatena maritima]